MNDLQKQPVFSMDRLLSGKGTDYYLVQAPDGKTTALTEDSLSLITARAGAYVICAEVCYLSKDDMERLNISFRKMPRDWNRLPKTVKDKIRAVKPEYEQQWLKLTQHERDFKAWKKEQQLLKGMKSMNEVYRGTLAEARERGEIENWETSRDLNRECARAIDTAIYVHNYELYHWDRKAAVADVIQRYGLERVNAVAAANVRKHSWDGRIQESNKAWAASVEELPKASYHGPYLNTHMTVLDGFIKNLREASLESPDVNMTIERLNAFGYTKDDMLPLSWFRARELYEQEKTDIYLLYPDNTEKVIPYKDDKWENVEKIEQHDVYYGIARDDWDRLKLEISGRVPYSVRESDLNNVKIDTRAVFSTGEGAAGGIPQRDTQTENILPFSTWRVQRQDNGELRYTAGRFFDTESKMMTDYLARVHEVQLTVDQKQEKDNYLKNAEMSIEDDYNMIDGIINNGKREEPAESRGVFDRLADAKQIAAAQGDGDSPSLDERAANRANNDAR